MVERSAIESTPGRPTARTVGVALTAIAGMLALTLAGCGQRSPEQRVPLQTSAAPPGAAPGSAPIGPPTGGSSGGPGMPAGAPIGPPGMGGSSSGAAMPGGPGMPGMAGGPAAAAPAVSGADTADPDPNQTATNALRMATAGGGPFPGRGNPFAPLDPPKKPQPVVETAEARAIRPQAIIRPFVDAPEPRIEEEEVAPVPRDLRTAGIIWGSTVMAILQQGDRTFRVRPGDTVTIEVDGPREMLVISISREVGQEGVTLRDRETGIEYFAPFREE